MGYIMMERTSRIISPQITKMKMKIKSPKFYNPTHYQIRPTGRAPRIISLKFKTQRTLNSCLVICPSHWYMS